VDGAEVKMRFQGERIGHRACRGPAPRAACALACAALLLLSSPAVAQTSAAYRQSLLAIQQQIEAGNLDDARNQIAAAARTYPHNGGLENLLGVVDIQQNHPADAAKDFSAAILHDPRLESAYLNLSRLRMQTAATEPAARAEALRLSLRVIQLDPASDEAHYQAATMYAWNKDNRLSLEQLKKLSAQASSQIGAQALRCADDAALGPRNAATAAAVALAANPDLTEQDADTCLPALRSARRADLIEPLFAAVATHQPLSAPGLRILGLAQEANGKLAAARATLESAFALESKSVVLLEDMTRVAKAAHDNEGALGYLAHARDLDPNNAALPYEFGFICVRMGLLAEARKAIAEALRLAPDEPAYNLAMGQVVSFSDDPSQALPYLKRFHDLRPHDAQGDLALGQANYRAKDFDTALVWLKRAVASAATAPEAHLYLGRIAREQGRLDDATAQLKQLLALQPDQPEALAELGQISLQARNYPQAETHFNAALRLDADNYLANFGLLQLYARTADPRRDQQSQRFDQIKSKKDERDLKMMRAIEMRPDTGPDHHDTQSN